MFTDARVTEPGWLTWLKQGSEELTLEVVGRPGAAIRCLADQCIKTVRRLHKEKRGDEVWLVTDWDADGKCKDDQKTQALEDCRREGVGIVLSRDCFELWPLLHLSDLGGDHRAAELQRRLSAQHPAYNHRSTPAVNWRELVARPDAAKDALCRALRLHRNNMENHCDPTAGMMTTAWLLTERIGHPTDEKASWLEQTCQNAKLPPPAVEVLRGMLPMKLRAR